MSEIRIKRLKRRFMLVAMLSLSITMLTMSFFLYIGNYYLNQESIRNTLDYIVENNGELTPWVSDVTEVVVDSADIEESEVLEQSDVETEYIDEDLDFADETELATENYQSDSSSISESEAYYEAWSLDDIFLTNRNYRSQEFQYATRYFVIFFDGDENVTSVLTSHINAVNEEAAYRYGQRAISRKRKYGRIDNYYYRVKFEEGVGGMVVYMDGSAVISSNIRLFYLALMINGFGMLLAYFIVKAFSGRAIQTEVKNIEIQKRFMTDASHELKTPLSVIRASAEMQEILEGETEWTQSILRQVERMTKLIQNLVLMSRAEEQDIHEEAHEVLVSQVIRETAGNLSAVAMSEGKEMILEIDDNVKMFAEEAQIRQLCSLLTDNAIKYCDDSGTIAVKLKQKGKGIVLIVSNPYKDGANVDYTRFFDRFYREDQSHNIDKGGYGIGLSVAEAICKQYHGSIVAEWKNGTISFIANLRFA